MLREVALLEHTQFDWMAGRTSDWMWSFMTREDRAVSGSVSTRLRNVLSWIRCGGDFLSAMRGNIKLFYFT